MENGKIAALRNGFGFIQPDEKGSRQVFFHLTVLKEVRFADLHEGDTVEYEAEPSDKGMRAISVRRVGGAVETAPVPTENAAVPNGAEPYRFLNPYNFVRYLERADDPNDAPEVKLLGQCAPPPHDRWVGLSGTITCDLKTVTPLFISDSEEIKDDKGHKRYGFFKMNGAPAIPASSLRGMVRAVFEAVTNSCYAVFDESPLSQHLEANRAPWLVPACVEKDGDEWRLHLLTGATSLQIENPEQKGPKGDQYAAWLASFWPIEASKTLRDLDPRRGPPPTAEQKAKRLAFIERTQNRDGINPDSLTHGTECYALLRRFSHPHPKIVFWNVVKVREKRTALPKDESLGDGEKAVRGWLCLTNQNIEAKHSERFFFRDETKATGPQTVALEESVRKAYEELIKDYQDRHEKDVRKRVDCSKPQDGKPAFSRFICEHDERNLKNGALVYAMLEGTVSNPKVKFIAPVSVPRVGYENSVGKLLPPSLHHCTNSQSLCPACRTFGWVRGERAAEGAYASRVRFSHAMITKTNPIAPMRLAILGAPKPTTTRFYLVGPDRRPSETPRDDHAVGYDGNGGRNRLRGRKFYRHHPVNEHSTVSKDKESDQNRTIADPQGADAEFFFTVDFENLAPVELGALLWSLEIGGAGYHRLGYGKPLGLGSVKVSVRTVTLRDHAKRYASLTESGDVPETNWQTWVDDFKSAAQTRWDKAFADLAPVQDLLALVNRADPTLAVHYPCSPTPDSQGAFEWFVGNKSKRGPKVELALATEDQGLSLLDKKGNLYAMGECIK